MKDLQPPLILPSPPKPLPINGISPNACGMCIQLSQVCLHSDRHTLCVVACWGVRLVPWLPPWPCSCCPPVGSWCQYTRMKRLLSTASVLEMAARASLLDVYWMSAASGSLPNMTWDRSSKASVEKHMEHLKPKWSNAHSTLNEAGTNKMTWKAFTLS